MVPAGRFSNARGYVTSNRRSDRRRLRRAFVASALLHVLLWPALLALITLSHTREARYGARESLVTISTRASIHQPTSPPHIAKTLPVVVAQRAAPRAAASTKHHPLPARVQHHELARNDAHAAVSRPKTTTALTPETIGIQEQQFAKTIAKARSANDPVANSQTGQTAAQPKHFANAYAASPSFSLGDGYLEPVRTWHVGQYTYYYLRYEVTYPDGTAESGIVPWPVRYLAADDPFARGLREKIPLLGPLADYVPDPATPMKPLITYCYEHHYASCPIAHD